MPSVCFNRLLKSQNDDAQNVPILNIDTRKLKVPGDPTLFPVPISNRIGAVAAADLFWP